MTQPLESLGLPNYPVEPISATFMRSSPYYARFRFDKNYSGISIELLLLLPAREEETTPNIFKHSP